MANISTLMGFLLLAWFIPAFCLTYSKFKTTPLAERKGFKNRVSFCTTQFFFIAWPIILVIAPLGRLFKLIFRRKVKKNE